MHLLCRQGYILLSHSSKVSRHHEADSRLGKMGGRVGCFLLSDTGNAKTRVEPKVVFGVGGGVACHAINKCSVMMNNFEK